MVRITNDTGFCIVRDCNTMHTDVATYYGEIGNSRMVVVRCEDNTLGVRNLVDFITEPDEVNCIKATLNVTCEVIGLVDESAYLEAMEKADKRDELMDKLKARAAVIEEDMYYHMLAEMDEEFAKLYKEYKEI